MQRRVFLTTAGSVLTAGCGALNGGNGGGKNTPDLHNDDIGVDPNGDYDTNIDGPDADGDVDTGINDVGVAEIDTGIGNVTVGDIGVDADVSIGDERQTKTASNSKAKRHIATAHKSLVTAYKKYVTQAGADAGLLDVNPAISSLHTLRLKRHIDKSLSELEKASNTATKGQLTNIVALRQVTIFVYMSAKIDARLVEAYNKFKYSVKHLLHENPHQARQGRYEMDSKRKTAYNDYSDLRTKIDKVAFSVSNLLSQSEFKRKLRKWDQQIAAFKSFSRAVRATNGGLKKAEDGIPQYMDRDWEKAHRSLSRATNKFISADTALSFSRENIGNMSKAYDLMKAVRRMKIVTRNLSRAADARANYEVGVAGPAQRAAQRTIESSNYVKDMRTFIPIMQL